MPKQKRIIIAEDDKVEQSFIRDGFKKSGVFDIVGILPNGHKLVTTLEELKEEALPDVILSDINMPLMTGLEALVRIKQNPVLASIPFVIFSTSKEASTESTCYNLGADQFMIKPSSFNEYTSFALKLNEAIT